MSLSNLERMMQLADEVFAVKSDQSQLDVTPDVLARLHQIHLATVSAFDEGNGPVAWVLLIPHHSRIDESVFGQLDFRERTFRAKSAVRLAVSNR